MKIIDTHTHIGYSPFEREYGKGPGRGKLKEIIHFMKKYRIKHSLVFSMPFSDYFDPKTADKVNMETSGKMPFPYYRENREVIKKTKRQSGLHPVLSFSIGKHNNFQDIQRLLEKNKQVKGLKFHPRATHSDLEKLKNSRIFDIAERHNLPIIIHIESQGRKGSIEKFDLNSYCSLEKFLKIAKRNPEIKFQGTHAGNFSQSFLDKADKLFNVKVDCSPPVMLCKSKEDLAKDSLDLNYNRPAKAIGELVKNYNKTIVFGSDYPWMRVKGYELDTTGELIKNLDDSTKEIMNNNANEFYSLKTA